MIVKKMTQRVQMVRAWTHYVTVTTVTEDVIAKFQVSVMVFFFFFHISLPIVINLLEYLECSFSVCHLLEQRERIKKNLNYHVNDLTNFRIIT